MDLIANLGLGFATALSPANLMLCFVGCMVGTLVGVLPGVGPIATIAMLMPITRGHRLGFVREKNHRDCRSGLAHNQVGWLWCRRPADRRVLPE